MLFVLELWRRKRREGALPSTVTNEQLDDMSSPTWHVTVKIADPVGVPLARLMS